MKKITLFLFLLSFITITSIEAQITTFPYTEDFESGDGGWVADNTTSGTWALGTPTGTIINSAASGSNSWVTNLSGTYNVYENSWVTSPVFDFSSLAAPSIELSIWYDVENSYDGAVLQSSIDGGSTWNNVGANGDPNNWYNDNTISGEPGGQQEGWTGTAADGTNDWVIARHALTGLAGESNVILRVAFGSDVSTVDDGFGFDDINIFEVACPEPTDITIASVTETSADISWVAGGVETQWDLEWGVSGFTPGTGTLEAGLTTTSFNLTGLTLGTIYDVYIVSNCESEGTSSLVGVTFNTQTPGGSCASAFPMVVEADCDSATPTTFDFSIAEDLVESGENPSCDAFANYGYWVSFTAPTIGSVVINFDGAADSVGLQVFESCGGTAVSDCNNNFLDAGDNSGVIGGLTPGDTYYAIIWSDAQSGSADVCIEEGPTCPFPINLEATNLAESSADLGWSENGTAASWNIEWGPVGFTQGTGTIINDVTTNPYSLTGLDQNTEYDFYVQSNCTGETSDFTEPFTFLTTPQTDFDIDCTAGPLTQDYCYGNNDTNVFTFTSTDGTALNLTFNSGTVEAFWDELVVLDSDGENLGNYEGDISGLTFQSSGDTISFYIDSDTSSSCSSGSQESMNYTISCATCVSPEATFEVVGDCLNGPQFFVEVDLTDLGSATSMTLSDNQGSADQTVSTADVYSFGPYPNLTDVVITAANDDDVNCTINSATLTQEICTETYIDCTTDGPLTLDLCYENGGAANPSILTYTSLDGTPLNLSFNSGFVENIYDELVVIDSDGLPFDGYAPEDNNYGNAGNVAGLTFQSTGDTISFYINSDTIFSCASGNAPMDGGINYTVSCATCINPQANFTVVDDCENGDQFLIDVTIEDLGDASSLTITNNIDGDAIPVTETGTYQMGPFPFLQDVVISVANDQDINCVVNSQPIQLLACPPENDNCGGAITAVVNENANCDSTTSGTILAATPSGVPNGSCPGDPNDDVWFEFTAMNEVQIISLLNITGGVFDLSHGLYEGECGNLTEIYCSGDESAVTPELTVGNTYYVRVFSGGSDAETSTFDLCIRPAPTNIICDNAENFCSLGGALTTPNIIGIPSTGSVACLGSAPNPTWNIIQVGESGQIDIQIEQTNDAGDGIDVDFVIWGPFDSVEQGCTDILLEDCPTCPNNTTSPDFYPYENIIDCSYSAVSIENLTIENAIAGEIYMLLVTNYNGSTGNISIDQTNIDDTDNGTIEAEITTELTSEQVLLVDTDNPLVQEGSACGSDSITLIADSPFADEFQWYKNGYTMDGETSSTLEVTESDNYYVTATDNQCGSSADSQYVIINLYNEAPDVAPQEITSCGEPGSVQAFDLDALTASLGLSDDFVVTYHIDTGDANQALNPIPSPYESAGETLIIRIEDADAAANGYLGCRELSQVELILNQRPVINQPEPLIVCDDLDGTVDGETEFDLESLNDEVTTDTNLIVTYHISQEDANAGDNALVSPHASEGETIFVRAEDSTTGCYETTSFVIEVNLTPLATFDEELYNYVVCPNATAPITIGIAPENFTSADVTVSWELDGTSIAGSGLTLDTVLLAGDYTAIIEFNGSGCTNTITKTVQEAESCVFPEGISPGVSPGQNDSFDLTSFDVTKLEIFNRNGTLVYSKNNYTDEWVGQTNDGKELPVGTYFYTVVYDGGTKSKSAWVYINR